MKLGGNPAHCFAVLVGIEEYGDGITHLSGPAMDALRLAEWLLRQNVPGERLHLLINFRPIEDAAQNERRDTLRQKLKAAGAIFEDPLHYLIDQALAPKNLPLPDGVNDAVLLLYFSGHGVCSETTDDRFLITADDTGWTPEAIDLAGHAMRLRLHPHSRRFAQQWLIQDACGQIVDGNKLGRYRAGIPAGRGGDDDAAAQYCLCSALRGEFSDTDPHTQESVFTGALLRLLEADSLIGLDLEKLYRDIGGEFQASGQHPTLWRRNGRHEFDSLPLGRTAPAPAIASLIKTLNNLRIHADLLLAVYADVTADSGSRPASGEALAHELDRRISARTHGLRNIELFAVRLASRCETLAKQPTHASAAAIATAKDYTDAVTQLQAWLAAHGTNQPALTAENRRLAQMNASNRTRVIVLEPGAPGIEARAWDNRGELIELPETLAAADSLLQRLQLAVLALRNRGNLVGNCRLEVVIPHAELQQAVFMGQQIEIGPGRVLALGGELLKMTVRVRERWNEPEWFVGWHECWEHYQPALIERPCLDWGRPSLRLKEEGWRWIGASRCSELTEQLRKGEPFAVWSCTTDHAQLQPYFEQRSYDQLGLLLNNLAPLHDSGQSITCLVDDFERVPLGASQMRDQLEQPT